jgi:ferredoxin
MTSEYEIYLDTSLCSGMGDCVRAAPDAFEIGPDGIAVTLISDTNDAHVLDAVAACPMAAIAAYRKATGEQVA